MSSGAVRAEILKLARLLNVDPAALEYLEQVPADQIRSLRDQVTEVLFAATGGTLGRLAAASKILPVGVVATIGERVFGAALSARITGLLGPGRAVEIADRLPIEFLADVAVDLDPRRASDVIARIPPRRIGEITRELVRRQEYVTMGQFVGHLGEQAISAALEALDDRSLLRTAFVLESEDGLDRLVALLPDRRLETIVQVAAADAMWVEALDLLLGLGEPSRRRFAGVQALSADGVLEAIVRTAFDQQLGFELLPLVEMLPLEAQRRVALEVEALDARP